MSIPKNHHHVSQCHIRKFFNNSEKKIYLYDKWEDRYFWSKTTKTIFSEKFSNSKIHNGRVNHEILEKELKVFEDDFEKITTLIKYVCENPLKPHGENIELMYRLALFGLIGEMRNHRTP